MSVSLALRDTMGALGLARHVRGTRSQFLTSEHFIEVRRYYNSNVGPAGEEENEQRPHDGRRGKCAPVCATSQKVERRRSILGHFRRTRLQSTTNNLHNPRYNPRSLVLFSDKIVSSKATDRARLQLVPVYTGTLRQKLVRGLSEKAVRSEFIGSHETDEKFKVMDAGQLLYWIHV